MSSSAEPRYGTPNWEMLSGWFDLPTEEDGPFWAVNLMKYRAIADYSDGRETTLTGREADDLYTPYGPLEAVGAMLAFGADVSKQISGSPDYDRIAIVRYPTRASFLDMQRREDFQELHIHKDAGMEFTTVISCTPESVNPAHTNSDGTLVMRVRRLTEGVEPSADPDGVTPIAHFETEGAIIGDGSIWHQVRLDLAPEGGLDQLTEAEGVEEQVIVELDAPVIDALVESVETAET
jgi:hypothetical protein